MGTIKLKSLIFFNVVWLESELTMLSANLDTLIFDHCVDSLGNMVAVSIPFDIIKLKDNIIEICYGSEFVSVKMSVSFKAYNRLKISKSDGWNASFIRDFSQYILE